MIHFTRCQSCIAGGHYDERTGHPWWDDDDVSHARATGQPDPDGLCACSDCGHPPDPADAARLENALTQAVTALLEGRPAPAAPPATNPLKEHP